MKDERFPLRFVTLRLDTTLTCDFVGQVKNARPFRLRHVSFRRGALIRRIGIGENPLLRAPDAAFYSVELG